MAYLVIVLALIGLVIVHELGHFVAARMVGIRATKFYVFFPPALFKKQIGEVEYEVGAIPAGGFVKLPGMFEPVPAEVAERVRWELDQVELTDSGEALRVDAATRQLAKARSADELVAPLTEIEAALAGLEQGAPVRRARTRITGLLDDLHPGAYWRAALWRRMTVIFAGPFVNIVLAFVLLTIFAWQLVPTYEVSGPLHIQVTKDAPAYEAGLRDSSKVIGWNGPIKGLSTDEFDERFVAARGKPTTVTWLDADGERHEARIVPRALEDDGPKRIGLAGVDLEQQRVGYEEVGLGTAANHALLQMRDITQGNIVGLSKIVYDPEAREEVGSVVGIVHFADRVEQADRTLAYVGTISLVLAVMNLLPLLPLDGGHLLFGLLEKLRRGRPLPRAAFERYSMVGLALVLLLFVIGLDNDIERIGG